MNNTSSLLIILRQFHDHTPPCPRLELNLSAQRHSSDESCCIPASLQLSEPRAIAQPQPGPCPWQTADRVAVGRQKT
jgi:hypothetical protein